MDFIKCIIRLTTQIFTIGFIIFGCIQLEKGIETIFIVDILLSLGMLFTVVFGIVLNRKISLHNKILNYLIPYVVVILALIAGVYIVNYLGISKYVDARIIGLGFTVFYLIYSLAMIYFDKRKGNRIHF